MRGSIQVIDPRCYEVTKLVDRSFNGYRIPEPIEDLPTMWFGHITDKFGIVSVGALTFYKKKPEWAALHTGCVHEGFRGQGFHIELIRFRINVAVGSGKSKIMSHAFDSSSRQNLMSEGFTGAEDTGTGNMIWCIPDGMPVASVNTNGESE